MRDLYVGLMSGTSLDGADGVLVSFSGAGPVVLRHAYRPFPSAFSAELLALNSAGPDELHRSALAANGLARIYADVVAELLQATGSPAATVRAVGAHGQTLRHRPQEFDGTGYTLQLNNPALLAELCGIDVVADFRSRDVAAGGQGAPLVPAFHREFFGRAGASVSVLNIGGISNLSVLRNAQTGTATDPVIGFDCGPGNALMDHWCRTHRSQPFDDLGAWAASGSVCQPLLDALMAEPYLAKAPPKSTGRDLFNPAWLQERLRGFDALQPVDVQATLCAFSAAAIASCVAQYAAETRLLIVCGGGALNTELMRRLQEALPGLVVQSSLSHGLPPMQVEAAAFAWLARKAVLGETASLESVTGAKGARILGAVYPR